MHTKYTYKYNKAFLWLQTEKIRFFFPFKGSAGKICLDLIGNMMRLAIHETLMKIRLHMRLLWRQKAIPCAPPNGQQKMMP